MKKALASSILKLIGWKLDCKINFNITKQAVIAEAPHTSNWDFFYALLSMWSMNQKINFLIKNSFFFFPLSYILKGLGGIPVDRTTSNNLVTSIVKQFKSNEIQYLGISAEGTRSYVDTWKSGFYRIAEQAKVPLYLGYIDYKEKVVSINEKFDITSNYEMDMVEIKKFYARILPKKPENFNLS